MQPETYAIIDDGTIVNVIVIDPEDANTIAAFGAVPLPDGAGIGWTTDGQTWTPPSVVDETDIAGSLSVTYDDLAIALGIDTPTLLANIANNTASVAITAQPADPANWAANGIGISP